MSQRTCSSSDSCLDLASHSLNPRLHPRAFYDKFDYRSSVSRDSSSDESDHSSDESSDGEEGGRVNRPRILIVDDEALEISD